MGAVIESAGLGQKKSIPRGFTDAEYVRTRPQMEQENGTLPALEGKASQGQFVQTHRTFIRKTEACRDFTELCMAS